MLAYTLSAFFAIAISCASAQKPSACSNAPFKGLGCLAGNSIVANRCATLIPAKTEIVTSTTSVLSVATQSTSANAVNQVTVNITNAETSTVTVTCSETPTSYSPVIATTCVSSTISTYVPATPTATRQKRQVASVLCQASGLAQLAGMQDSARKTACSCLGHRASTTTSTKYVTVPIASTTTSFAGRAPTVTSELITRVTITVTQTPSAVIVPISTTTTLTETTTLSYAAPTYTQIYGPQTGCADVGVGKAQPLAQDCTSHEEAVSQCQHICEQEPTCRFLYVQRMFTNYGSSEPYYECYMNNHELDQSKDLQCGKQVGIFGNATGYDACGRGTTVLNKATQ